ncbi:MAG: zf-HC2 domain-containing protein [Acidobacteriia bacterium]|nr:zf-HC2 domain-containing protein [Terriglobia bacterium]
MDWNCAFTEERLSDFLDGALAPAERAALSAHAAQCEGCGQTVARVGAMVRGLRELAPVEEPPYLVAKILRGTLGARASERTWERWLGWLLEIGQPRFAMGVATVAVCLAIVLHVAAPRMKNVKAADLHPVNVLRATNRQAHLTYARGVKFVNDLRVVYEIQSRFASQPEPAASPAPGPESNPTTVEPRDRSQSRPRPGNRDSRFGDLVVTTSHSERMSNTWTRSLS